LWGGLLQSHVFDSFWLSNISDRLSTASVDAYLFESKVEVVVQSCFQILRWASISKANPWDRLFEIGDYLMGSRADIADIVSEMRSVGVDEQLGRNERDIMDAADGRVGVRFLET